MCTVVPETVQLPVAPNETVKPEDAVAPTVKFGSPYVFPDRAPKLIVWFAFAIGSDRATSGAGL